MSHPVTSLVNRVLACAFELRGTKEVRLCVRLVGFMRNKDAALLLGAFRRERKYDDACCNLIAVTGKKTSVKLLFTSNVMAEDYTVTFSEISRGLSGGGCRGPK